jgi:hypothetical protein
MNQAAAIAAAPTGYGLIALTPTTSPLGETLRALRACQGREGT